MTDKDKEIFEKQQKLIVIMGETQAKLNALLLQLLREKVNG